MESPPTPRASSPQTCLRTSREEIPSTPNVAIANSPLHLHGTLYIIIPTCLAIVHSCRVTYHPFSSSLVTRSGGVIRVSPKRNAASTLLCPYSQQQVISSRPTKNTTGKFRPSRSSGGFYSRRHHIRRVPSITLQSIFQSVVGPTSWPGPRLSLAHQSPLVGRRVVDCLVKHYRSDPPCTQIQSPSLSAVTGRGKARTVNCKARSASGSGQHQM